MRKLYIVLAVMGMAAPLFAGTGGIGNAGSSNPYQNIPAFVHSYTKDYVIPLRLAGTGGDTIGNWTIAFMLPEAAELMKAWLLTSDSTMLADTVTNYWKCEIHSNSGTAADTAAYFTALHATDGSRQLVTMVPETLSMTTTITKRQFDKGEVGKATWTETGTPTHFPKQVYLYMLFRPKDTPIATDCYVR